MKTSSPSAHRNNENWSGLVKKEHQILSVIIASTGGLLVLFFLVAFTFPLRSKLLESLYPKQNSEAFSDVVVLGNTVVSVPIELQATENVTAIDVDVSVAGGTLEGLTCGGASFENTSKSTSSKCVIFSPSGAQNGVVAMALVKSGTSGTLAVNVDGNLSTADGNAPTQGNVYGVVFRIVQSLTTTDKLYVPVSFNASEAVTAADYTLSITGGELLQTSCGGSGFREILHNNNNCVVFNVNGVTQGVIGSAVVRPTTTSTSLSVNITGTLSTESGRAPSTGTFNNLTIPVNRAASATPTNMPSPTVTVTPSPTVVPTATTAPTPSTAPGTFGVGNITSPTYSETVGVQGTKEANTSIWLNGTQIVTSNTSTTWSTNVTLDLGTNTLVFSQHAGGGTNRDLTQTVDRRGLGDINGDEVVNVFDVGIFAGHYNETNVTDNSVSEARLSDMRKNGVIDVFDLGILAGRYGSQYTYN
ncbi:hypothetical protein HGA91_04685 [candidate division WWE3 bacterium]|nr:hypothetical protein [candidate division WWE3 bacterium]